MLRITYLSWIGLWSKLPVRDLSESIKSPLWFAIIVLYEATPGRTDLRSARESSEEVAFDKIPSAINKVGFSSDTVDDAVSA